MPVHGGLDTGSVGPGKFFTDGFCKEPRDDIEPP